MLYQRILLLLQLWVGLDGTLEQQLNIAQLGKVEISLLLQTRDGLPLRRDLLLQRRRGSSTGRAAAHSRARRARRRGHAAPCAAGRPGARTARTSAGHAATRSPGGLAPGDCVVLATGVVLVPVPLDPLEEFEVVLHAAFREGLDGHRLVYLVLGKDIWCGTEVRSSD